MLHRMWDHISNCYARAADAGRRADLTSDPESKADFLLLEENWKRLAQSYELSEQLERTLLARNQRVIERIEWQRAAVAPFDRVLELAVMSAAGIDAIGFPCRRVLKGWIAAASGEPLDVKPTHWREWRSDTMPGSIRAPARRKSAAPSAAQASPLPPRSNA